MASISENPYFSLLYMRHVLILSISRKVYPVHWVSFITAAFVFLASTSRCLWIKPNDIAQDAKNRQNLIRNSIAQVTTHASH